MALAAASAVTPIVWRRASAQPLGPAPPPLPEAEPAESQVAASADLFQRMTVPVTVNGHGPYPFIVDTGSNRTVISQSLAAALSLPLGEMIQFHSATGYDAAPTTQIARLGVGARAITGIRAPVLSEKNIGAAGMLGIDAIIDQNIIMDFRAERMTIQASSRKADDPDAIVVRARSRFGQLLLVDSSVNGVPLFVILDTGGELSIGNLALRDTLWKRKVNVASSPIKVVSVTGASIDADATTMPTVRLGGVLVNNMPIAYADMHTFIQFGLQRQPAILLGMNVLRHFDRVAMDFKARQVRFLVGKEA